MIFLSQLLLNDNNFNNLKQINNQSELNGFGNNNNNDNSNNEKDKPLFNAKVDDMVLNKKVNNKITYLYLSFEVKSENEDIKDMIEENKIEILDKIIIHFDNMYKIDFSNKSDKEFLKSELINVLNEAINDKEALIKDLYFTTLRQECPLIYWWDELLFFTSNFLQVTSYLLHSVRRLLVAFR